MDLLTKEEVLQIAQMQRSIRLEDHTKQLRDNLPSIQNWAAELHKEFDQFEDPAGAHTLWKAAYLTGQAEKLGNALQDLPRKADETFWFIMDSIRLRSGILDEILAENGISDIKEPILEEIELTFLGPLPDKETCQGRKDILQKKLPDLTNQLIAAEKANLDATISYVSREPQPNTPPPEKPIPATAKLGIEIEGWLPSLDPIEEQINYLKNSLPVDWDVVQEWGMKCPILNSKSKEAGLEVISPPLPGTTASNRITRTCETLQGLGFQTNHTTGLHIHVEVPKSLPVIKALAKAHIKTERENPKPRERNTASRSNLAWIEANHPGQKPEDVIDKCGSLPELIHTIQGSRHYALNLFNLLEPNGIPTAEFRAEQSTLDPNKILTVASKKAHMVEKAKALNKKEPDFQKEPAFY